MSLIVEGALELGITLDPLMLKQFSIYFKELERWSARINLTSIIDEREVIIRHFLDSLVVCRKLSEGERLLDMGTGGGFPGIPLKIVMSGLIVTLMDATAKKITFLSHIIRTLELDGGISAIKARAEDSAVVGELSGSFDVVTSRAFASLEDFLTLARPYIKENGRIIAIKGPLEADLEASIEAISTIEVLKALECKDITEVKIPFSSRRTTLITFSR